MKKIEIEAVVHLQSCIIHMKAIDKVLFDYELMYSPLSDAVKHQIREERLSYIKEKEEFLKRFADEVQSNESK